jgi:hypothetical protein
MAIWWQKFGHRMKNFRHKILSLYGKNVVILTKNRVIIVNFTAGSAT